MSHSDKLLRFATNARPGIVETDDGRWVSFKQAKEIIDELSDTAEEIPSCALCGMSFESNCPCPSGLCSACNPPQKITVDIPVIDIEGDVIGRLTIPIELAAGVAILGLEGLGVELLTTIIDHPDKLPELVSVVIHPVQQTAAENAVHDRLQKVTNDHQD